MKLENMFRILFLVILPFGIFGQVQIGQDIYGEAAGDRFGRSVSLSSDGSRIAVGSTLNEGNGEEAGHTRIFEWDGTTWQQMGEDIDGEAAFDLSGFAVALSADGNRVAISAVENDGFGFASGHVRVFEWDGMAWQQIGEDIDGVSSFTYSGRSVSLSSNGNRIAIGAIYYFFGAGDDSGHTRIFEWDGTAWQQMGGDIEGEAVGDQSGVSVSLSADGQKIAVGARFNKGGSSEAGHTQIFEWDGNAWQQMGGDINGEGAWDRSGSSVSLSANGIRVAIGAPKNAGGSVSAGHTRVFEWDGMTWQQMGGDIDGEDWQDRSGSSVSLSSDGTRVAIGAPWNNGNGEKSGHTRIYDWDGSDWKKLGEDIDGVASEDLSGLFVSLSGDGTRVSVGALGNDGNGEDSGHARIFELSTTSNQFTYSPSELKIYPSPAAEMIHLKAKYPILSIEIYEVKGRLLRDFKYKSNSELEKQINISNLLSGIYVIKVETSYGTEKKKFIVCN